jgi:serine phosphatase RsbU (regulator of sigma subunit)
VRWEPVSGVVRILVIEDDPGDALLAQDYLSEESGDFRVHWSKTLAEGMEALDAGVSCVLLDLGLPDSQGVSALDSVRAVAPRVPIVVLTGFDERAAGMEAVAAGAQDYLVKGEAGPGTLVRSIRYAMARAGNEDRDLQLLEAELRRQETQRLALGLKPQLRVSATDLHCVPLYQPAGRANLLGGDFLDAVELPDGTVRMVLGDVSGHGPEEAALGVSLRVGWRSLVLAGNGSATLDQLERLLVVERTDPHAFATVCDLTVHPDRSSVTVALAGHPPPLVVDGDGARLAPVQPDPPLGVAGASRNLQTLELVGGWLLLAYSDGIFEGRDGNGGRVGLDAFVEAASAALVGRPLSSAALAGLVDLMESHHGGPLDDDVALLACQRIGS